MRDQPDLSTTYNQTTGHFLFLCEGRGSRENATRSFVVWSVDGEEVQTRAVNASDDGKFMSEISPRDLGNFTYGSRVRKQRRGIKHELFCQVLIESSINGGWGAY